MNLNAHSNSTRTQTSKNRVRHCVTQRVHLRPHHFTKHFQSLTPLACIQIPSDYHIPDKPVDLPRHPELQEVPAGAEDSSKRDLARPDPLLGHLGKQAKRGPRQLVPRVGPNDGVPGPTVSVGHLLEQVAGVEQGAAFSVALDDPIEEKRRRVGVEGEKVALELPGLGDGVRRGAGAEEVGVEGEREGDGGGEEDGDCFREAAEAEVVEDRGGECVGGGRRDSAGRGGGGGGGGGGGCGGGEEARSEACFGAHKMLASFLTLLGTCKRVFVCMIGPENRSSLILDSAHFLLLLYL
ncbi:hypothetical protein STAS_14114 [Striga asiatica]|uniref:Uncharacterized protein n=1 Tax=Striga asiatica TaxID=4170 RepID=A0A5A7PXT8_STRAF|nr:hypothetical protein STAS_14114 [Striga asiatica]